MATAFQPELFATESHRADQDFAIALPAWVLEFADSSPHVCTIRDWLRLRRREERASEELYRVAARVREFRPQYPPDAELEDLVERQLLSHEAR